MNPHCNGDFFPTLGIYRCLKDGSFIKAPQLPEVCLACGRKIKVSTTYQDPEMRIVIQRQVKIDLYPDCWVSYEEIITPNITPDD